MKLANRQRNLILLLPAIMFLTLCYFSIRRGHEQPWHDRCLEFWKKRQWHEIVALANNLQQLGKADAETLSFAMVASVQLHNSPNVESFAAALLHKRILNRAIESQVQEHYRPTSFLQLLELHRSDIILGIFCVLVLLQTAASLQRERTLPWISALSAMGIILLIL